MNKQQIYEKQSLFDVALQHTGDPLNAFYIAQENGLEITEALITGLFLDVPELEKNTEIHRYYEVNGIKPATELSTNEEDLVTGCEGIECWSISNDFIIS